MAWISASACCPVQVAYLACSDHFRTTSQFSLKGGEPTSSWACGAVRPARTGSP